MDCTCRPEHHPGSSARAARPPRACNLHAQSSLSFDLSLSSPPWRTWAPSNLKGFSFCLQTTSLVWSFSPQLVTKSARSHLSLRKAAGNPCKSSGSPRAKATALPVRARFHSFASRLLRIHHRLQTHAPRLRAGETPHSSHSREWLCCPGALATAFSGSHPGRTPWRRRQVYSLYVKFYLVPETFFSL